MIINILIYVLLGINILVSLLLVLLILMQRPKSEGLGTAFGSGVTESLFGAQTSDVLTKTTLTLGAIFIVTILALAVLYSHRKTSSIDDQLFQNVPPIHQAATMPEESAATTDAASTASSIPSASEQEESGAPSIEGLEPPPLPPSAAVSPDSSAPPQSAPVRH